MFDARLYKRLMLAMCTAALAFSTIGCGNDSPDAGDDGPPPPPDAPPPPPPPPAVFGKRASRSSTIAISDDDARVAMVNPDDNSISVFETVGNTRTSKVTVGANPSSIVIAGDNTTAYVANRNDGTVSRVIGINTGTPTADATVDVGSEPVGLALSPSGRKLFVAEFAQSRVSIVDTQSMQVIGSVDIDRPRALVVTNNADESDDDERLLVSQFFGVPVAGKEVKDDGRTGRIMNFPLTDISGDGGINIDLPPLSAAQNGFPVGTSANQLGAMAVNGNRVYITSVSASPQGPTKFDNNVFPVVYVADLTTNTEVRDATGTANLAKKVLDLSPAPNPRFMPGDLSDIAFLDESQVGYTVGRAGDVMLRLQYGTDLVIGAAQNKEIDLLPNPAPNGVCQNPTGLVVSKKNGRGYVNCWVNRRLAVVDFGNQALATTVEASAAPADPSIERGKRFYFTGRARWSNSGNNGARGGEGWSSCGSCHPDGLTDNITWAFGTGPRQTTSMDGSFSHAPGVGPQKQRMFNWTGVNDEMHDFEANVRGVSGGLGVITNGDCSTLATETPVVFNAPLGASNKDLTDVATNCKHTDWDDINNFVKTISPPHSSRIRDAQAITNGKALFIEGGCDKCHGGAGWTISRRPYNPLNGGATTFGAATFTQTVFSDLFVYDENAQVRTQISAQPEIAADETGPGTPAVGVLQLACGLRNVGTFGVPGNDTATTALEVRAGTPAQGRAGYNIPSLYGLALGAPYLHHGQSPTLEDLLSNSKWAFHAKAGNPNFEPNQTERADLIKFLLSIDAATAEIAIPSVGGKSFDICPGTPGQSPGS